MTVAEDDTAKVHGTGDAAVLSTPRLLQLMQQATMTALDGHLPDGVITAGLRVNLDHLHGSPVGAVVEATGYESNAPDSGEAPARFTILRATNGTKCRAITKCSRLSSRGGAKYG